MNVSQALSSYSQNVEAAQSTEHSLHQLPSVAVSIDDWLELAQLEFELADTGDIVALDEFQQFLSNAITPLMKHQLSQELIKMHEQGDEADINRLALLSFSLNDVSAQVVLDAQAGELTDLKQACQQRVDNAVSNDPRYDASIDNTLDDQALPNAGLKR